MDIKGIGILGFGSMERISITENKGFHFMLPKNYSGVDNMDLSVEYMKTPDGVLARVWAGFNDGQYSGVRRNVDDIMIDLVPDDEIIDQLISYMNKQNDLQQKIMTAFNFLAD